MPDLVAPKLHQPSPAPRGTISRKTTPSWKSPRTSRFSAAHRIRMNWCIGRPNWAIARSQSPISTRSPASSAPMKAWKEATSKGPAPKLIVGTRLTLNDFPGSAGLGHRSGHLWPALPPADAGQAAGGKGILPADARRFPPASAKACWPRSPIATSIRFAIRPSNCSAAHSHVPRRLRDLRDALGDRLSLAICRLYGDNDARQVEAVMAWAKNSISRLLATNCVYYHDPSRRALQDVLTCIRHCCRSSRRAIASFPMASDISNRRTRCTACSPISRRPSAAGWRSPSGAPSPWTNCATSTPSNSRPKA